MQMKTDRRAFLGATFAVILAPDIKVEDVIPKPGCCTPALCATCGAACGGRQQIQDGSDWESDWGSEQTLLDVVWDGPLLTFCFTKGYWFWIKPNGPVPVLLEHQLRGKQGWEVDRFVRAMFPHAEMSHWWLRRPKLPLLQTTGPSCA